MTTPTPVLERDVTTEEVLGPPYVLLLFDDNVNSMDHVVNSLTHCVPELDHARAADVMLEAHANGMARVITCPHDRAARYRNCLESFTATIEPA